MGGGRGRKRQRSPDTCPGILGMSSEFPDLLKFTFSQSRGAAPPCCSMSAVMHAGMCPWSPLVCIKKKNPKKTTNKPKPCDGHSCVQTRTASKDQAAELPGLESLLFISPTFLKSSSSFCELHNQVTDFKKEMAGIPRHRIHYKEDQR